jgi:uncharacterized protein YneR
MWRSWDTGLGKGWQDKAVRGKKRMRERIGVLLAAGLLLLCAGCGQAPAEPKMQSSRQLELIELDFPLPEQALLPYAEQEAILQSGELPSAQLAQALEGLAPQLRDGYYMIRYNASGRLLFLTRVIPTAYGAVYTGVNFTIGVNEDSPSELSYSYLPTAQMLDQEKELPERIRLFRQGGGEKRAGISAIPNTEVEKETYYGYDYRTDELRFVAEYEITHWNEDGTISTKEVVLPVPTVEEVQRRRVLLFLGAAALLCLLTLLRYSRKRRRPNA